MVRPLTLLVAIAAAAPLPAMAQTFPAGAAVVASAPTLAPQSRAFALLETTAPVFRRPDAVPPAQPDAPMRLKARTARDADEVPQVDIRAKSEWSDDQGFRATPTKVSYKVRF